MTYNTLTSVSKVIDWARTLVTNLTQRDAKLEERLKDIETRLTAGGL